MAEEHDFLDDLIEIQSSWQALSNPLGDLTESLMEDPANKKTFKAGDYKEKPFANATRCLRVAADGRDVCSACLDVCPVDAIQITDKTVKIEGDCRKCMLCVAVCPTETLNVRNQQQPAIYERVARAASAFEQAYVTCTRAMGTLGRLPRGNEIVLPCVGAISRDLWFAILTDYINVSVFLPEGICDRCRTFTGEELFSEAIAIGEEWGQAQVGLEVDEAALTHELTRAYKRSQFISSALNAGERLVTRTNPMLAGAKAVANKIKNHKEQLARITREIEEAVGAKSAQNRLRYLTMQRKLVMAALQRDSGLAESVELEIPVFDPLTCTACGECVTVCTTRALDQTDDGRIRIEPTYCVNCAACALVCPEDALTMEPLDANELVVVDEESIRIAKQKEKAHKEAKKLIEKGKKQLNKLGDVLETLDDSETSGGDAENES